MTLPLLLLLLAATDTFEAKVVAVKDGDSIVVLRDKREVDIRLEGIDCPELTQAFGRKAKKRTSQLCFGKYVTVRAKGMDRYGRTLADITLPDGTILNQELVRDGFAWWFHKYSKDKSLGKLESDARAKKRGLWSDAKPVAPWDWRAARRRTPEVHPDESEIIPNGVVIVALLPNPKGRDAGNEQVTISNMTDKTVELDGWKLIDKAGNVFLLTSTVKAGKVTVITMTEPTMPLNNDGDTIVLIDGDGVGRSMVNYSESDVGVGLILSFKGE